ncbi:short-chain dehydrogenase [Mycobacterium antarcticum]|uniref:SDR family NAD(P)-dependent oxidoreductase n=1 Tax=Mycolicibacterium sp. TUM20983 TaxID=3023369 RepID=UPI0023886F45|nr:SDR family NAD(P)-dependent oxidoreductase [Mycolicibacterium sp. TUM20983]GLP75248.1 short-chain dehydrogenase [Mycolicibacterium sp. TUM20983]
MARFADRVAIVTGAGAPNGIGAEIARQLVEEGARVVMGATSERIHERSAELGPEAVGVIADLTVDGAADTLVRAALQKWGRLDVLVNNAGMTSVSAGWDADDEVADLSLADWEAAISRNLTTAFLACKAAIPVMRAAGYGRIVSIGSTTGTVNAMPGQSTYTAAKAGLVGLTQALALEVVTSGITVNVVAPGYVSTGSQLAFEADAAAAGPIGRSGTPQEIAACVLFLAHESASFVTGSVLVADGGHNLPETWNAR